MRVSTHKRYDKAWAKLNRQQQLRALAALKLFTTNPNHPSLRIHQLKGEYYPQYSISAGGDLRIHYSQIDPNTIILMLVGTHAQLYG